MHPLSFAFSTRIVAAGVAAILAALLFAAPSPAQSVAEPNDSVGAASGPLVGGQTYSAQADPKDEEGDDDWYYFGVAGPATVKITLANTTATPCPTGPDGCNLRAFLADNKGNVLFEAGPRVSTIGPPEGTRAGEASVLEWNLPTGGTYTVRVGANDAGPTYNLTVEGPLTATAERPIELPPPPPPPPPPGGGQSQSCRALNIDLDRAESQRTAAQEQLATHASLRNRARSSSERRRWAVEVAKDKQEINDINGRIRATLTLMRQNNCTCGYLPRDVKRDEELRARLQAALKRHVGQRNRARTRSQRNRFQRLVRSDLRRISSTNGKIRANLALLASNQCTCALKERQLRIARAKLNRDIAARNRARPRSRARRNASRRVTSGRATVARLQRELSEANCT